jgi:hypothetical protein
MLTGVSRRRLLLAGCLLVLPQQIFAMLPPRLVVDRSAPSDPSAPCEIDLPSGVTRTVVPAETLPMPKAEPGQPRSWSECVAIYDQKRGDNCNSSSSFSIRIRNVCAEPIDARFCIERTNGTWDCGMHTNLRPGERTSYYTCNSTFYVWRWARQAGTSTRIPEPRRF